MSEKGAKVSIHQGRVDDADDCNRVVKEVMERFGRVDYLINNAGITIDKTVRKMTVDDWRQVLDVNLSGAFQMTKAVLEHMIERGSGRIVNISSVIGETGNIGQANYAASKAGLFGFTKSLALEMAQRGITVNCVAPGFIATEMVTAIPEAALAKVVERSRSGGWAVPRKSRASCGFSWRTTRATSPARSIRSTADWICEHSRRALREAWRFLSESVG